MISLRRGSPWRWRIPSCPTDFLASPNNGGAYKAWVTPVNSFIGLASNVDNPCGAGCFHGFLPSASKTDNFKVNIAAATFCLDIKQLLAGTNGNSYAGDYFGSLT